MSLPSLDFFEILQIFHVHEVSFMVVGGVSAVLQGAPITTFDLDILSAGGPENAKRMMRALKELDAHGRAHSKKVRPNVTHLEALGHLLLKTRFGYLDVLGSIGKGYHYEDLLEKSKIVKLRDINVRVLNLDTLIRIKEETGREKDKAMLPILRATVQSQS